MPWTPAQRRLFAVHMRNGELSRKEFNRRMGEGTRKDVDRSGHAKKAKRSKRRGTKKATHKRAAVRSVRRKATTRKRSRVRKRSARRSARR